MKLINDKSLLGIDKTEVAELIAARKFIGVNQSPRQQKVIVSLTSYDKRIHDVKYTIYSLLNQIFPPDKLILWLDEDSFPQCEDNLPRDLLELRNFGLTIDWCENLRSYKKLIPALEEYPDDIIVTADDDIFYHPYWLKSLYDEHLKNPDCVIAHRCRPIKLDLQGNVLPYKTWKPVYIRSSSPYYTNFFTGAGGVLYRKKFFHNDILRREIFTKLVPIADDVWFWAMTVLGGTKIKTTLFNQNKLIYVDTKRERSNDTLWSKNKTQNDIHIRQVMENYPALLNALIREQAEIKPHLSIVLLLKDADNLGSFIKVTSEQRFIDFEIVAVNTGSRIEISNPPNNLKIVEYPGGSQSDAFNIGLQKATGEYILFQDFNSTLAYNSLSVISEFTNGAADVVHFTGHIGDGKFVRDGLLRFEDSSPVFLDNSKQNRAQLWLQDALGRRLATKIFKREFLLKNEINFEDNLEEFMFRALIYAENYLLVPRAFCLCQD